ncbi:MAG TPA: hypothetical protein EYH46_04690 [Sulfurivirga caldicuralii]|nr:hypothetical protein [Sulfurivirga caldicuralii]
MIHSHKRSLKKQRGASIIEYALIVAAVVAIGVYAFGTDGESGAIGSAVKQKLDDTASQLEGNQGSQ